MCTHFFTPWMTDERFPFGNGLFSGDHDMKQLKAFVAGGIALMLASSPTAHAPKQPFPLSG
jgi:hypothetical protein